MEIEKVNPIKEAENQSEIDKGLSGFHVKGDADPDMELILQTERIVAANEEEHQKSQAEEKEMDESNSIENSISNEEESEPSLTINRHSSKEEKQDYDLNSNSDYGMEMGL